MDAVTHISAHAEDAGWGRVSVTVRSIDEEYGGEHVLRLGADGSTWGWHPIVDGEDAFTFRIPDSAVAPVAEALAAMAATLDPAGHPKRAADHAGPSYKRLYEIEKDRADMLLDAVLKSI